MSVNERRMFCLIWLLGGGGIVDTGGAEAAGCGGLDEEWLEETEEAGDDASLEEDLLSDAASFFCGCFFGIVKLDFVTLSAPVMWIGPGGKGDGGWMCDGPGFLDFAAVLLWDVTGFLDTFELEVWREDFLSFGETLAALVVGAFLFPLTSVADAGEGFSGECSASFCSFPLCFSSLGGAGNQEQEQTF